MGTLFPDFSKHNAGQIAKGISLLAFLSAFTGLASRAQVNCSQYAPAIAGTVTDVSCNGAADGAVGIVPTGGLPPYTYAWSNGAVTPDITGLAPGTYSVTVTNGVCQTFGVELVNNSGFENGNTAFGSAYDYCNSGGCLVPEGRYAIGGNAATFHGNFVGTPHAGGNFMIVNGSGSPNTSVWCQTITVQPNTVYNFSTWVTSVNPTSPALLQFSINGAVIGNVFQAPAVTGTWSQFFAVWYSGANTTASICIVNQNTTASGNDFGLDDISFMECINCSATRTFTVAQPQPLQATVAASTSVGCNGAADGTASLSVTGGTAPYTVSWPDGQTGTSVTGLAAGTHTAMVTDARGCTASASVTIAQPAVLSAVAQVTGNYNGQNVRCNGGADGSISAVPAGGTAPYTYLWSNGAATQAVTGVGAGTYTVTVTDAHGCTAAAPVTVTQPSALSASAAVASDYNGQNLRCNGSMGGTPDGVISAGPAGGTAPYAYLWSNGAATQAVTGVGAGTYTVTVTDANGCTADATVTVAEPPVLTSASSVTSNYNGQQVSCNGSTDGSLSAAPAGGTAPYTYLWSNGAATQTLSGVGAGTYSVTVTDANGCTATSSVTVTEPASALSATAQVTSNYNGRHISCNGRTDGSLSATPAGGTAPYTYLWGNGAVTQALSGVGAGTYNVTVTDANGCTATASVTVNEPLPLAAAASVTSHYNGRDVSCSDVSGSTADGTLAAVPTGGTAPYGYLWNNGSTVQNPSGVGAGTYSVTVTDANGCTANAPVTVTGPPALTSSASVTGNHNGGHVSCYGGADGSVAVTPAGGTAPYTYLWSNGAAAQTLNGVGAGTYSVTVTDANGCTAFSSVTVTGPSPVQVGMVVTGVSCYGTATGAIDLVPTGGTGGYTYAWSYGAVTQNVSGLAAGAYTVAVTDANGCTVTVTRTVGQPSQALGGQLTINHVSCYGGGDGRIEITASGGTAPYTYAWTDGSAGAVNGGVPAGSYGVTVTDSQGCLYSASGTVQQPAAPLSVSGTVVPVLCYGAHSGSADITVTGGTPGYSCQWSHGPQTEDVAGLAAGTYSVTVTDSRGCTAATYSVTVIQPQTPLAVTGVPADVKCHNDSDGSVDLTVTGGTAPYTYLWSTGAATEDIQNLSAGTYDVTVTDAGGCQYTSYSAQVGQPAQPLSVTGKVSHIDCFGGVNGGVNLTVTGGSPGYTYQWSNGSAGPSIGNVPAGQYGVTVGDGSQCIRHAVFDITEPPKMFIGGSVQDNLCHGNADGAVHITVTGGVPGYRYEWNNGAVSADITRLVPGNYTVSVTDANGCNGVGGFTVFGAVPLSIALDPVHRVFIGDAVELSVHVDGGTGSYSYVWTPEDHLSCPTCPVTMASPPANTTYVVTVTDGNHCPAAAHTQVLVDQDIFIPNAFTPNGNGTNDTFRPVVRMAKECTFSIFNRWGELIYSSWDANLGWDGNFNGTPVQVDVYVYRVQVLFYNGIEKVLNGNVAVLR